MDLITFRIPGDLIDVSAAWWYGDTIDFVLNPEVNEWLKEQKISPEVRAVHRKQREPCPASEIQYDIIFKSVREATLFKLRWF